VSLVSAGSTTFSEVIELIKSRNRSAWALLGHSAKLGTCGARGSSPDFLSLIGKVRLPIQRDVPTMGTPELGSVSADSGLLRQKIVRHFPDFNNRVHEGKVAIWAR
jgi:hypothetical protein